MNRSIPVFLLFCPALLLLAALPVQAGEAYSPPVNEYFPTMVYWGDTHVHTSFSWDAWSSWGRISPDDAYRFAKGETVVAHNGQGGAPVTSPGFSGDIRSCREHGLPATDRRGQSGAAGD